MEHDLVVECFVQGAVLVGTTEGIPVVVEFSWGQHEDVVLAQLEVFDDG